MATGSGKTVVMAMLIAWQALNKLATTGCRFSDTFLIVTPGITIRDRLRVLLPNDPKNYYRQLDLVPSDLLLELGKIKIVITNFHAFLAAGADQCRANLPNNCSRGKDNSPFTETPDQMVRRVCRELGNKKNIIVINDEAHHCYRRKPDGEQEKLTGDERKEAEKREEEAARLDIGSGGCQGKDRGYQGGLRSICYTLLSARLWLSEGTLFPWVVSDFSLIDAIEAGIVKVPRVPVADDSMVGEQPTYRDLWLRIRDELPKKGRKTEPAGGDPTCRWNWKGRLTSLYSNYEKYYRQWEQNQEGQERGLTPPVFIVVCNNTNVSKLVFDYMAGWEKTLPKGHSVLVPGKLTVVQQR